MSISYAKTKAGFNFAIGGLTVARASWAKKSGVWSLMVFYLEPKDTKIGIAATSIEYVDGGPDKVVDFLVRKMAC